MSNTPPAPEPIGPYVTTTDPLICFFYELLRDVAPAGEVERIVMNVEHENGTIAFTNGHLATYAGELAARLRSRLVTDCD